MKHKGWSLLIAILISVAIGWIEYNIPVTWVHQTPPPLPPPPRTPEMMNIQILSQTLETFATPVLQLAVWTTILFFTYILAKQVSGYRRARYTMGK